ncbi:hypothetical protein CO726_29135 [Bacillus fungorum]|uniref:Uncharacterized protein n=1 Tax=Bacillus fungorum TaxID=2039284 RepID=A0A2G6Q5B4_9BACI|nr:hypothetical protein [Bacillus fungorum]PIE91981.1 hypothetical protein CO726_29135 [Bacillus fungorum]
MSFLYARTITEAIKRFQGIYTQYAEQVPFYIREVHTNEKIIIDTDTGEVHCIGDNNMLRKCLENLMHSHTPINWVPLLETHQNIIQEPPSFIIDTACLSKDSSLYNKIGIDMWENTLQISLYSHGEFWNALKRFLQIEILSVCELEQFIKGKRSL